MTMTMMSWTVLTLVILGSGVQAFCPHKCVCDNDQLQVTCFQTQLEVSLRFDECKSFK